MNSIMRNSIVNIINNYSEFFFNKKNVVGIGFGHKVIKNITTNIPSLHVFVENKTPLNGLYKHDIIPNKFFNISTDIIDTGNFSIVNSSSSTNNSYFLNNLVPIKPEPFLLQQRIRPLQAGFSIAPAKADYSGTLGAIVFDNETNKPYILSNSHVLCDFNKFKKGTSILQPSPIDGKPSSANKVAKLSRWINLEYSKKAKTKEYILPINWADCAIAEIILPNLLIEKSIRYIGSILGTISDVSINEPVQKLGSASAYTTGTVTSTDATLLIDLPQEKKRFYLGNLIIINNNNKHFSFHGDSGSLVLNSSNKAIGLLCGMGKIGSFATPIESILKLLNIHFEI